jgi:hypothetical protein
MDPLRILDRSDMGQPRRPSEFYKWVMAKFSQLAATDEAKAFARSGAVLPKKFYDEVFPLAIFAEREFAARDDVLVQPNLDNDNFDGRITVGTGSNAKTMFVEITYAKVGYDESLRMEFLCREGHVSLTGPVSSSGRKGWPNRKIHVEDEAVSHLAMLENYLVIVRERLKEKTRSCHGRNHVLVVAVDDHLPLRQPSDVDQLRSAASSWLSELTLDFGRLVFLGMAGNLYLSYDLED